jgi:hypothetical protein
LFNAPRHHLVWDNAVKVHRSTRGRATSIGSRTLTITIKAVNSHTLELQTTHATRIVLHGNQPTSVSREVINIQVGRLANLLSITLHVLHQLDAIVATDLVISQPPAPKTVLKLIGHSIYRLVAVLSIASKI